MSVATLAGHLSFELAITTAGSGLLVFDNCEDEALLAQWRPTSSGCRVLVTSRRAEWDAALGVRAVALGSLRRAASVALLRAHRPDLATDDADLAAIASELGDLPLALHLAGSFLARYRRALSPAAYLEHLRRSPLLEHPSLRGAGISPTGHEQHVARTFALSYERLDPAEPADATARALLARAAHFAPGEPIPRELLLESLGALGDDLEEALRAEDALVRLTELGLADADVETVRLHRLIAAFVRAAAAEPDAQWTVERVVLETMKREIAAGLLAPLLPHLRAVADSALDRADLAAADLAIAFSRHLFDTGDYAGVRPYSERSLELKEKLLGRDHPQLTNTLVALGWILMAQEELPVARLHLERALTIREHLFGPDHPQVADTLVNLGAVLRTLRETDPARSYLERAFTIRNRLLGPEHRDTVEARELLASLDVAGSAA